MRIHLRRYPENPDTLLETSEGETPRHQFQIRSSFRLANNLTLDTALYRVSQLPVVRIPGYTRLDLNFGWKVREGLDLSLGLQNLLDGQHPEFASDIIGVIPSQVKRSIYGKVTWRF